MTKANGGVVVAKQRLPEVVVPLAVYQEDSFFAPKTVLSHIYAEVTFRGATHNPTRRPIPCAQATLTGDSRR